jgi:G3E family GTPase
VSPTIEDTRPEVFIIAGFLGSGKTTLLRNILNKIESLEDTAVIINEFGQVGIDSLLVKREGLHILELVNGCICCSLTMDLSSALSEVSAIKNIRRIYIEATGLAEPRSIISLLKGVTIASRVHFRGIISILDARLWDIRNDLGSFFMNQLRDAIIVILNKIDLIEKSKTAKIMNEMNQELPESNIIPACHCNIDLLGLLKLINADRRYHDFLNINDNESSLASKYSHMLFSESRPFDSVRFERLLRNIPPNIIRVKGLVRYPKQTMLLNLSFGEISWDMVPRQEETCLEFIGKEINKNDLIKRLLDCLEIA